MINIPIYLCVILFAYMIRTEIKFPKKERDIFVDVSIVAIVDIIVIYYFIETSIQSGQLFVKVDNYSSLTLSGWLEVLAPFAYFTLIVLGVIYGMACYRNNRHLKNAPSASE